MKKILLLLFFVIMKPAYSQVPGEWKFVTPIKESSEIISIETTPNNSIYMLDAANSYILCSTNQGQSWKKVYRSVPGLKDMWMLDDNTGYVLQLGGITKTTDGFQTTTYLSFSTPEARSIFFFNENLGFLCGGVGRVYRTTNQGASWSGIHTGATGVILEDVFFITEDIGFACGSGGKIFKTINQGASWTTIQTSSTMTLNKLFFVDENTGYVAGNGGKIYKTVDQGETWIETTSNTSYHLNDIKKIGNTFIAVGGEGCVVTSPNGNTWIEQIISTANNNELFSVGEVNGFGIIGGDGRIFNSINITSWSEFITGIERSNLIDGSFSDSNRGVIIGNGTYYSAIFRTTDGGKTWITEGAAPSTQGLYNAVHMRPDGKGINVGSTKYRITNDYGDTWPVFGESNPVTGLTACWLKANGDFFVGTNSTVNNGLMRKTSSGWTQWTNIGNVVNIKFKDDLIGYTGNEYGKLFKTLDGGNTWLSAGEINYGDVKYLNILSENVVYADEYKTIDGGQTWEMVTFEFIMDFHFFTENNGVGLDGSGSVYSTIDGGANWEKIIDSPLNDPDFGSSFTKVLFFEDKIIGLNPNSDIYLLEVEEILGIDHIHSKQVPVAIVHPNPANDRLYISTTHVVNNVAVYDASGKEIFVKYNGEYLDISNLQKNIYFVKIETGNGVAYKKVVKN